MFEMSVLQDDAHIGERTASQLNRIVSDGWEGMITFEFLGPPMIPIVALIPRTNTW